MKVEIRFREDEARVIQGFLRARYKSKASLETLCKLAIRTEVAAQAKIELEEAEAAEAERPQTLRKSIDETNDAES